jgi:hypothetical protein
MAHLMSSSIFLRSKARAIASSPRASAFSSSRHPDRRVRRRGRCVLPRARDSQGSRGFEERRDRPDSRPARPPGNSDEQALALREAGKTYAAVARSLGLKRAVDAQAAFLRALRRREGDERNGLVERETARLVQLEARIRTRDAADPEKMKRRLLALAKLREQLG